KQTPVSLDLDEMDAKLAAAMKTLEARNQQVPTNASAQESVSLHRDTSRSALGNYNETSMSMSNLRREDVRGAQINSHSDRNAVLGRPSLDQHSQSFKATTMLDSSSKYFQRPHVSPIKFRSKYRTEKQADTLSEQVRNGNGNGAAAVAERTNVENVPGTRSAHSRKSDTPSSTHSSTPRKGDGRGVKATGTRQLNTKQDDTGRDQMIEVADEDFTPQNKAAPTQRLYHFDDSWSENQNDTAAAAASPKSLMFNAALLFVNISLFVRGVFVIIFKKKTNNIQNFKDKKKPQIHHSLIRQANKKKIASTRPLYNRPRISISVPTSPRISDEETNNEEHNSYRKSHHKSTSQAIANKMQLEEVLEEPSDLTEDGPYDTIRTRPISQFQQRNDNSRAERSGPAMLFEDNPMAIHELRAEIQESRSATAVGTDRNKQNIAQRVAQRRRRLNMKA
ncbi:hypothetical protein RFI_06603, partial [Reticulomyxa filosa]